MPRTYHLYSVPLRAGSLFPGTEDDASSLRAARLPERLRAAGCSVIDEGDVAVPSYLPHHSLPPIRNWPAPRIVWDSISKQVERHLQDPGHVPLLIGCDCSVVVGTTQALLMNAKRDLHVIYVDGDLDYAAPDAGKVQSAAMVATWILTHPSPFWSGPPLKLSQLTVVGADECSGLDGCAGRVVSRREIQQAGAAALARRLLNEIPEQARVLLHFDVDVLRQSEFPAAYFPHAEGLTIEQCTQLLSVLAADPRISIIEVAEYAALRDANQRGAAQLIALLQQVLNAKP